MNPALPRAAAGPDPERTDPRRGSARGALRGAGAPRWEGAAEGEPGGGSPCPGSAETPRRHGIELASAGRSGRADAGLRGHGDVPADDVDPVSRANGVAGRAPAGAARTPPRRADRPRPR